MSADVQPSLLQPGGKLTVRSRLEEFGVPFSHATVGAEITNPGGTSRKLVLGETATGVYEGTSVAIMPGVYSIRVTASGTTSKGVPFTRETIMTSSVFAGANDPLPGSGTPEAAEDTICCLIKSLLRDKSVGTFMKKRELDPDSILKSVEKCCSRQ